MGPYFFRVKMQFSNNSSIMKNFTPVQLCLDQVRDCITQSLCLSDDALGQMLSSFDSCSGKMLRPALLLLSAKLCGDISQTHIKVASIIEMLHNATLIHDDVIDDGQLRRGIPTVNSLYGNEKAVLIGDFFLTNIFSMCTDLETEIAKNISDVAKKVCIGELKQTSQSSNWQLTEKQYIEIITEKSASIFSTSCLLGVLISKADIEKQNLLENFGTNFGIAFQIADDLEDITGKENLSGKTLGTDAKKAKLTLPLIHMLSKMTLDEKADIIKQISNSPDSSQLIRICLKNSDSIEYVHRCINEYLENAVTALDSFPPSPAKAALVETALALQKKASLPAN